MTCDVLHPPPDTLLQLQLLQQHARRGDIAAAIESAIGTLQVRLRVPLLHFCLCVIAPLQISLREQQLNDWSQSTAADARACGDMVCAVCLDQLCAPSPPLPLSFYLRIEVTSTPPSPHHRVGCVSRPLRTLVCPGQHVFHEQCARSWLLQRQATCPLCRLNSNFQNPNPKL